MKDVVIWIGGFALVIWGINSCSNTEWYKESQRKEAKQFAAAAQPHPIRTADGCTVYEWKDQGGAGTTHYFTRCGPTETVTTERHYMENCGKNCHRDKSEITVTQPKGPPA